MAFPVMAVGKVTYNSIELSWDEKNNNEDKKIKYHVQLTKARSRSPSPGAPALDPLTNYQGTGQLHVFKGLDPLTEYLCRVRIVDEGLGHGSHARWSQPSHVTTAREPPSGAELHKAVVNKDLAHVRKVLLENNTVVEVMDKHGMTPLMAAAQKGFLDVMETLIELGAEPDYMNSSGKTCLIIACYAGKEEAVKLLREQGVPWSTRDKSGLTAVHWAAEGGHDDLLLWMFRDGAEVDVEGTVNGWTPLMRVACVTGNYDVAEVLIAKGAEVNKTDKSGKTILMAASMNGHFDMVRLLVEKGADIMCKNREGKTALDFAQSFERHRIIKFLDFQYQKEVKQRKAKLLEEKQREIREQSKILLGNAKAQKT